MKKISLVFFLVFLAPMAPVLAAVGLSGTPQVAGFLERKTDVQEMAIRPGSIALTRQEIDALINPGSDLALHLPSLERHTGNEQAGLEFSRINVFASNAQIRVVNEEGVEFLAHDNRHFYLATNATTGIGIAFNPDTGEASGFINRQGNKLEIRGNIMGQIRLAEIVESPDDSNSCGTEMARQPLAIQEQWANPSFMSASDVESGEIISYTAVVAIETDSEWLDGFNDNTTQAMNWITDIFLAMNVFYERDVETRLLIGDVTLWPASDPYSVPSDRFAQLNEFGSYWKDNMDHVDRQFAAMLSGRNIPAGYFSGIAWINQFCENGRTQGTQTAGSYSYNAIGSGRTAGNTAIYLGHEIGHNMGSSHTHCYSPPLDRCYNAADGCYSGVPECPAGGKGTIMSYCHVRGSNGADCGPSKSEFHPTVQALMENNLSDELAVGCILPYDQVVPEPEFSSQPATGSTLDFGSLQLNTLSDPVDIRIQNMGDAVLTVSCSLSGPDTASFDVNNCPLNLAGAEFSDISLSCTPSDSGALSASLSLTTNDPDEGTVVFGLTCTGEEPVVDDIIFAEGFEPGS